MVGGRVEIHVDGFAWDYSAEGNIEHLRRHGVERTDVEAVLMSGPIYFRNAGTQASTHAMIGRDRKSRSLIIYLLPTSTPGIWQPVTGWQSRLAHRLLGEEGRSEQE